MLNLPNLLAFLRILLAPLMFWIILNPDFFTQNGYHISWNYYTASLLFVLASVTDFFDGYIAREWNQMTMLGAIIDPLADKMLTIAAFLGLMMIGEASAWAIYIIIIRELFITGIRTVAVSEGLSVKASWAGKIKTVAQMFAIGFLLMHWPYGTELLWFAVALTLYSGFEYLYGFRASLLKGKNQ
ncbi:MAG: CDP-diacylglycerol--glycerol-3-phosphate 3-phosphatidyltransferase [Sulfurimonas sp. RIFOXYD12_FULL_33_39]|uniref:CDP-diacylglycerol--glycerol-3-phosphate 3-phosphatidyltransferase n=1 Tax=unclassified Sulfurimonas TaxID=2623549 RepID=UPI0008B38CB4|nr:MULTISPECIES: CDP-diacylglycerol--glycerol-3-phosphate 3-phosphatidyltransferase [unclassified Sulfurimonas]OHE07231.1 MAG: CDP-diacylglycerol--glycerol-3-phosphate 3-phosphatidyltransferase [Sulfurimonas sp. RIFCSPLOWO2_12_FULL_34_6]OHE09272.1 MAG: CDP-diacylglycerol--glycerol-3-phosphate 3-phosphatidyltransferase [Sulfurimonas sp. RIFOXYD12_FULL_33_39]OHE12945.1 MAG: CDP-diacylglycerol--glycerol-3-phosphate 3-phosphatidyltransferase [Sulfurimonas sp. RIFOXYD2_FULL_34_21]DAB27820.1 MAG TPA: